MKLGRREMLIAVAAAAITALTLLALMLGSLRFAVAGLAILLFGCCMLQLLALRHVALRQESLDRVEQKLDVVARRVVTESEATGRELGGQIEALRQDLRHE